MTSQSSSVILRVISLCFEPYQFPVFNCFVEFVLTIKDLDNKKRLNGVKPSSRIPIRDRSEQTYGKIQIRVLAWLDIA